MMDRTPERERRPQEGGTADQFDEDLHPNIMAGIYPAKDGNISTAYDIKDLHNKLQQFTNDELKQIPVLPPGTHLHAGSTYIDLRERNPEEVTGKDGMQAATNNWYVPKSEVDYVLWNRLIGVDNPERLDEADEG